MCHVSAETCRVSERGGHVMCHASAETCHVSARGGHVMCHASLDVKTARRRRSDSSPRGIGP